MDTQFNDLLNTIHITTQHNRNQNINSNGCIMYDVHTIADIDFFMCFLKSRTLHKQEKSSTVVLQKICTEKLRNVYRKIHVSEPLF